MKIHITDNEYEIEGNLVDIFASVAMILADLSEQTSYDVVKDVVIGILEQIEKGEVDGEEKPEKEADV